MRKKEKKKKNQKKKKKKKKEKKKNKNRKGGRATICLFFFFKQKKLISLASLFFESVFFCLALRYLFFYHPISYFCAPFDCNSYVLSISDMLHSSNQVVEKLSDT